MTFEQLECWFLGYLLLHNMAENDGLTKAVVCGRIQHYGILTGDRRNTMLLEKTALFSQRDL